MHTLSFFGESTLIDGVMTMKRDFMWVKNKLTILVKMIHNLGVIENVP